jgi:hypothetical protein
MNRNPWAYAIDYGKAIAQAERELAIVERVIAAGAFGTPGTGETILDLAIADDAIAAKLELTGQQRADLADYFDWPIDELPASVPAVGIYSRGRELADRLEADFGGLLPTADQAKTDRRRIKARLASYRRKK